MPQNKYRVFELSARAVMSYATQENGQWNFALDRTATEKCKCFSALHEQDSNALFFQIMCVLQGDDFSEPTDDRLIDGLSDVIFYMDFSGIFDRSSTLPVRRRPGICFARRVCVWIWELGCAAISHSSAPTA